MAATYPRVIVDAGPLVAILDQDDEHHVACIETMGRIQPPLWTTWPVLTEVAWLLRGHSQGLHQLYSACETGLLRIATQGEETLAELYRARKRFATLSLQLADLSLIVLSEREHAMPIFTLDRRDFSVVRKKSRRKLTLLPESLHDG
jgi:predicted nucleic acid-binding protein